MKYAIVAFLAVMLDASGVAAQTVIPARPQKARGFQPPRLTIAPRAATTVLRGITSASDGNVEAVSDDRMPASPGECLTAAANRYHLPVPFLLAIIGAESMGDMSAVSSAGAIGIMQLMPRTAAAMGVTDIRNPCQNIMGGARYLRRLANRFRGNLLLVIAAYNAGEWAVIRYHGVPPYKETRAYVRNVLARYRRLLQQRAAAP